MRELDKKELEKVAGAGNWRDILGGAVSGAITGGGIGLVGGGLAGGATGLLSGGIVGGVKAAFS